MNNRNRSTHRTFRNKALVGAIVAALAVGAAGTAVAQSVYQYDGTAQTLTLAQYIHALPNQQMLSGTVSAIPTLNQIGYVGPAAGGALTVNGNVIQAMTLDTNTGLLGANGADNSIDLGLLANVDGSGNEGLAILSGQLATNKVTTLASSDQIGLDVTNYTTGNATVNSNTINSSTLVNGASNAIAGALPTTAFDSSKAGTFTASYTTNGTTMNSDAGVAIGSAQFAVGVASSAGVTDGVIALVNAGASSSAPVTVSDNTANASDAVNRASNSFSAAAGGAVSYTGSVVVGNGQANLGGSAKATVSGTDIGAELDGTTYSGALSVSNDRTLASSQGNSAGNEIAFGSGINVAGASGAASLSLVFGNSTVNASADGDLLLSNIQGNQQAPISGTITDSRIGATLTRLNGGSLTTDSDVMAASASGNSANNSVSADGASFGASVAVGNQQTNDASAITATATNPTVGVIVSGAASNTGDVTVSNSSISAQAQGSDATTNVDVAGTNFDGHAQGVSASGSNAGFTALNPGSAGVVVGNLQGNYGAGTNIKATVTASNLSAAYANGIGNGSNVSVSDDSVTARAGGNSADTSAKLSGTNGTASASLGNGQYNANNISATVNNLPTTGFMGITTGDATITGAQLTVGNNVFNATAFANQGSNNLATDFDSTLGLTAGTGAGSTIDALNSTNAGNGGLVLLSDQINDGANVAATMNHGQTGVHQGAIGTANALSNSTITVSGNSTGSSAIGNTVSNTVSPGAGSLVRTGAGTLASLGNLQQISGNVTSTTFDSGIGFFLQGSSTDLTGTLSNDELSAFAGGNIAANGMAVSGTVLDDGAAAAAGGTVTPTLVGTANGAFVLQNMQYSTAGTRSATIDQGYIGGSQVPANTGNVTRGTLTATGNSMSTDARDNYASNSLGFSGYSSLNSTGTLQSAQVSAGALTSAVTTSGIGLSGHAISASTLTVSNNAVSANAIANTAVNQFSAASSSQLAGDADDTGLPVGAPAGYRGAVTSSAGAAVLADYSLSNEQARSGGSVAPKVDGIHIGTSAASTLNGASTATVSSNAVGVVGQDNLAVNGLGLSGSSVDATAAIGSVQSVNGSNVTSSASNVAIGILAGAAMNAAMPLTATDNTVTVLAGINQASNALSVDASSSIADKTGFAGASSDITVFPDLAGATADYSVANRQESASNAKASLSTAFVGITAGGNMGAGTPSSYTVTGNHLDTQASGNGADNSVSLNAASSIDATAAVANLQRSTGTTGSAISDVTVTAGNNATGTGSINHTALTVSSNRVSGSAAGNSATNAIDVSAAALNGAPSFAAQGSADGDATNNPTASTASADYALNNSQFNGGAISSTIANVNIGTNVAGGIGAVLNSTATVGGNTVSASGVGNSAGNSILLASVASGTGSSALTSNQINTANVTSSVSNAHIGVNAGATSNSPVTVSGNTISATAVGNSATNHIGIGN